MSWDPNQGQDPNQPNSSGGDYMQQPNNPYGGQQYQEGGYSPQQGGYQGGYQQGGYQQGGYSQQGGYQQGGYQQGGYQQGGYQQGGYQQSPYGQQQPPYGQQQQYGYQQPYGAPPIASAGADGPTSTGMSAKAEAGLSYLFGWVTGIIFFLLEKQNRFVRFNAMQSILFFGGITVIDIFLRILTGFSPGILALGFGCVSFLVGIVGFVGWIVLMINGFQGKYYKLPVIGDYAQKYADQSSL